MAGGDDHREPSRDVLEEGAGDRLAFGVGQRELLGIVGQQAQPVDPRVNQVVHDPRRAAEVDTLVVVEDRRDDRHDAGQRSVHVQVLQVSSYVRIHASGVRACRRQAPRIRGPSKPLRMAMA